MLDKAERLRNMDASILPAFLNLAQLTGCNVCVLLLSQIVWEKFLFGFGSNFFEPFVIHFPDYTKSEWSRVWTGPRVVLTFMMKGGGARRRRGKRSGKGRNYRNMIILTLTRWK